MIQMTLAEVAAAVAGTLAGADPHLPVTGTVEFDSRKVGSGGLFVAFPGEKVDGHDFAAEAIVAGAVAVVGTRRLEAVPMVLVPDPLAAMAALARTVLERLVEQGGPTVLGLTGSSGKTTTKDLLAQLTGRVGSTVAPAGSLNNELGLPYTVLRSDDATRFLVLEMGARGPGHIAHLCQVATPDIGVVLNVGMAHVGEFGSVAQIAASKGELVAALPASGLAVLNADDDHVAAMSERTAARVVRFGESPAADVRATGVRLDDTGRPSYRLVTPEGEAPVRLSLVGAHQVANSLAVAAVGRELGMPLPELAGALGELRTVSPRRMDVHERPDGVTVVDDSYNANPASVAAALRALVAMGRPPDGPRRRIVAVLGYLAELGPQEREGHEQVGRLAAELGVDLLVVVSEAAAPIHHAAVAQRPWEGASVLVADQEQAVELLAGQLRAGDVVLVKGSRYRTWEVADRLREPVGSAALGEARA